MLFLVVVLHTVSALVVALYSVSQLHLWFRARDPSETTVPVATPMVTVQLPLRNERTVVEALLESIAALEWPADRLLIQVLDDSDDETTALCRATGERLSAAGHRVVVVTREERTGYKAGALQYGLATAEGDFVAIFDADFRPRPDFLRQTVPSLVADPGLGLVQARWGHLNRDASVFTRSQAFHLDAHFTIEQAARSRAPLLMGFNGTAGVWRRAAIEEAGGWSADSLTEDLDLAFRAQLAGWRLTYADHVEAPAELPEDVRAIRTQQHRWMKGGAQVARKLFTRLWRSSTPLAGKLQGSVHLLSGAVFLAVVGLLLTTPLLGPLTVGSDTASAVLLPGRLALQFALGVLIVFYLSTCMRRAGLTGGLVRFFRDFVPFMALSTGLAVHNSVAVLEGWSGKQTPFVRTPKVGADGVAAYRPLAAGPIVLAELALALWGATGLVWALWNGQLVLAAFLAMQVVGCAGVALGGRR